MPGRVYAEVDSMAQAQRLAGAIDELNRFAIRSVPIEERFAVLRVKKGPSLRAWAWVRICDRRKRWEKYRGDVGIVRTRDPDDFEAKCFSDRKFIYLVPRLVFTSDSDQTYYPPPQRLATRQTLVEEFGMEYLEFNLDGDPLTFTFRGEDYDPERGLLVIEAEKIAFTAEPNILPSRHELRLIYQNGFLPRPIYLKVAEALEARQLANGTRVMVKRGDFKGLVGIIRDRRDDTEEFVIELPSQGLMEPVLMRDVRAEFRPGDKVKVINGIHNGMTAWVLGVDPESPFGNVSVVNADETFMSTSKTLRVDSKTIHPPAMQPTPKTIPPYYNLPGRRKQDHLECPLIAFSAAAFSSFPLT